MCLKPSRWFSFYRKKMFESFFRGVNYICSFSPNTQKLVPKKWMNVSHQQNSNERDLFMSHLSAQKVSAHNSSVNLSFHKLPLLQFLVFLNISKRWNEGKSYINFWTSCGRNTKALKELCLFGSWRNRWRKNLGMMSVSMQFLINVIRRSLVFVGKLSQVSFRKKA